ncbi:MAG TPA: P-loop NTPase, partial [Polyangiaceae bacterium]|nr:P-loop NTPase [Polyangiaceae bacterium]
MSAAKRIAVMEGELEGIDLAEVLQVVGIGRQYTGVELRKADQTSLGTLFIKAGKVVSAVAGTARGRDAFFQLFQQVGSEARKFFHVFRMETPNDLPEPIGSLGNLMLEALARAKNGNQAHKAGSGMQPRLTAVRSDEDAFRAASDATAATRPPAPPPSPPSSRRRPSAAGPIPVSNVAQTPEAPAVPLAPLPPTGRSGSHEIAARQGTPGTSSPHAGSASGAATNQDTGGSGARERGGGARSRIVLGVVSPKGGSGKTTIALNLALSFARQERSVVLVDADINGDVLSAISARERAVHGAIDVLLDKVGPEAALLKTVLGHFRILPALGDQLPDAATLLAD